MGDEVLSDGDPLELSIYDLSARHDVRDLVVKTLLTYLELEGILQPTGAIYTQYKFQPQRPSAEILKRFDPARAKFVGDIFKQARPGFKVWLIWSSRPAVSRIRSCTTLAKIATRVATATDVAVPSASRCREPPRRLPQPIGKRSGAWRQRGSRRSVPPGS